MQGGAIRLSKTNLFIIIALLVILSNLAYNISLSLKTPLYPGNTDPITYHEKAAAISGGDYSVIDDYYSTNYYMTLSLFYKIFSPDFKVGKILNSFIVAFISCLTGAVAFLITRKRLIALFSVVLVSFDPILRFYSYHIYKEPLLILCLLALVLIAAYLSLCDKLILGKKEYLLLFAYGFVISYASLINGWVWAFAAVLPAYLLALAYSRGGKDWLKPSLKLSMKIFLFILLFAALSLALANVLVYKPLSGGYIFKLSNDAHLLYISNNPSSESNVAFISTYTNASMVPVIEWAKERYGLDFESQPTKEKRSLELKYVINFWLDNPGFLFKRVLKSFFLYWSHPTQAWSQLPAIPHWSIIATYLWLKWLFAIAALVYIIRLNKALLWKSSILIISMLIISAPYLISIYLMRYKTYLLPFQAFFAAISLYLLYQLASGIIKNALRHS